MTHDEHVNGTAGNHRAGGGRLPEPQDGPASDDTCGQTAHEDDVNGSVDPITRDGEAPSPEPDAAVAWAAERLAGALDAVLPHARAMANIDPADGGHAPDELVEDPASPGSVVHPDILEAERILHECANQIPGRGDGGTGATTSGLEDLDGAALVDDDAPFLDGTTGDPLTDSARRFIVADESIRARRIACMSVPEPVSREHREARAGLLAAAREATDHSAAGEGSPSPHDATEEATAQALPGPNADGGIHS